KNFQADSAPHLAITCSKQLVICQLKLEIEANFFRQDDVGQLFGDARSWRLAVITVVLGALVAGGHGQCSMTCAWRPLGHGTLGCTVNLLHEVVLFAE